MTLTQADHTDLGPLLAFACGRTSVPAAAPEYRRALGETRTEPDFRLADRRGSARLGRAGAVRRRLRARPGGRPRVSVRLPRRRHAPCDHGNGRLLAGLAWPAWPRTPTPTQDLEEERVRRVTARDLEQRLRAMCERMHNHDAAGDPFPRKGWTRPGGLTTRCPPRSSATEAAASGRQPAKCTRYWVRNVLGWLGTGHGPRRQFRRGPGC